MGDLHAMVEDLLDQAIHETGIGRHVAALSAAVNRLRESMSRTDDFWEGCSWIFDDENEPEPTTNKENMNMQPVQKYTVKGGAAGSTSSTTRRNVIPGVTGPATGRGAPVLQPGIQTPARITGSNNRRRDDERRRLMGWPSVSEEEQIIAQAGEAIRTHTWSEFLVATKKRLSRFKGVPQTLQGYV